MKQEHLAQIEAEWKAQNRAHTRSIRCCSACTLGHERVPLLLAEIKRLSAGSDDPFFDEYCAEREGS